MDITRHKVYKAILQKNQFLGCDRELTMLLFLITFALAIGSLDLYVIITCLIMCAFLFYLLTLMAKRDLMLRHVYLRNIKYKKYYTAKASVFAKSTWK